MLIAESMLLLSLHDRTGRPLPGMWPHLDAAIGASLLLDLADNDQFRLEPGRGGTSRVGATSGTPQTGNTALDAAAHRVSTINNAFLEQAIGTASSGAREDLLRQVTSLGFVYRTAGAPFLGIFPRTVWPAGGPKVQLRDGIRAALDDDALPDAVLGQVIAVAYTAGILTALHPAAERRLRRARTERGRTVRDELLAGKYPTTASRSLLEAILHALDKKVHQLTPLG